VPRGTHGYWGESAEARNAAWAAASDSGRGLPTSSPSA